MNPGWETVVNMFFSLTFAILIVKDFLDLNFFLFHRSQVLSLVCVGFQEIAKETDMRQQCMLNLAEKPLPRDSRSDPLPEQDMQADTAI